MPKRITLCLLGLLPLGGRRQLGLNCRGEPLSHLPQTQAMGGAQEPRTAPRVQGLGEEGLQEKPSLSGEGEGPFQWGPSAAKQIFPRWREGAPLLPCSLSWVHFCSLWLTMPLRLPQPTPFLKMR